MMRETVGSFTLLAVPDAREIVDNQPGIQRECLDLQNTPRNEDHLGAPPTYLRPDGFNPTLTTPPPKSWIKPACPALHLSGGSGLRLDPRR